MDNSKEHRRAKLAAICTDSAK